MNLLTIKERSFVRRTLLLLPRWVTPNGVTVFRTLLLAPVWWLMTNGAFWPAMLVLVVSLVLDFVDGALALVRDMRSETGAFLDPLADKIVVCCILFLLTDVNTTLRTVTWVVTAIAVLLTLSRVVKVALVRNGKLPKATSVAASSAGKLKMTMETSGVITLLIARGDLFGAGASPYFEIAATLLLVCSLRYAVPSLWGQLRGLKPACRP